MHRARTSFSLHLSWTSAATMRNESTTNSALATQWIEIGLNQPTQHLEDILHGLVARQRKGLCQGQILRDRVGTPNY